MENKKKHSSIPSNYVTLVQLQERWIKEQQRKQTEKEQQRKQAEKEQQEREEQEKREREEKELQEREEREQREREEQEQREREEQERRLEEEKKLREKVCDLKQTDKEETSQTNSKSIIRQKPYRHHNYKANRPNSDEPQDKAEALTVIAIEKETRDEGLKNDDQEKKKKKRMNKPKPKRGEEMIGETEYGGTAEPETEKEVFKYFPARRVAWGNGIRGELRWKRKNPVANGKVSDSDDHVVVEVEQKFEDLSINNEDSSAHVAINEVSEKDEDYVVVEMNGEEKFENLSINRGNEEGKSRSRVAMNGPRGWYRGPQRLCRGGWGDWNRPGGWGSWNRPRENGSWTWVRKGEGFDGDVRAQPN